MAADERTWRIGEVATATGLTVRAWSVPASAASAGRTDYCARVRMSVCTSETRAWTRAAAPPDWTTSSSSAAPVGAQVSRGVAVCFRDGPSAHAEILVTADGIGSADYERQMVGYGFAAVRASRGAELATTWRRSAVLRYLISHLPPRNCRTAEPRSLGGRAYRRRISAIVPGRHIP